MSEIATALNGRIPPKVERVTFIRVTYCIGKGTDGDPFRPVCAYYDERGGHMWSFSCGKLLATESFDAQEPQA